MTTETPGSEDTGPLELLDSARTKYTLAQARIRRGPPELALLALHGSLEDALRAHALRRQAPAAYEPFPQLLEALTGDAVAPLSAQEAEGIQRMHRVRGRVARGEQISITAETIDAYQRLAARLLPRYGVLVVGPEDLPGVAPTGSVTRTAERTRPLPARERSAYPDDREARATFAPRGPERVRRPLADDPRFDRRPGAPTAARRYLEETAERVEAFSRIQGWLVPFLIIFSIFMIGATISIGWQQLSANRQPTAAPAPTFNPAITTVAPATDPAVDPATNALPLEPPTLETPPTPAPTDLPADAIAVGRPAFVRPDIQGLNVRAAPSDAAQILFSLAPNTQMDVIDGPVEAGGFTWWEVSSAGQQGWAAGEFLSVR